MPPTPSFPDTLEHHQLSLVRGETTTLQVNIGLTCDLACRHCHLEAGPHRSEMMTIETAAAVIACAERLAFQTIDITGGAPELLPHLPYLVERLAASSPRLIVRTNLTALARPESQGLIQLYRKHKVAIVASLPAANAGQTAAQRGLRVWESSLAMLRQLNSYGYGEDGSELELNLVANPSGAFLPGTQEQTERKFRQDLQRHYDIRFTRLFTFANVPLGRFRAWLEQSGNFSEYHKKLAAHFNPCTLPGLMCRSLIAVDWNGHLYDCDFNLSLGLHHSPQKLHISQLLEMPVPGMSVPVGDHCYACTAGSGFT